MVGGCLLSFGAFSTSAVSELDSPAMNRLSGHLEIGTRMTGFQLKDPDSGRFIGSINHLGEKQDYIPYKVFADVFFSKHLGVELT